MTKHSLYGGASVPAQPGEASAPTSWRQMLDERHRKAIAFAETYVRDFNHGTVGHNDLVLIARLAELLDVAAGIKEATKPPEPANLVLTFGKYRDRRLGEVFQIDPGYVDWLAREGRDEAVRTAVRSLLTAPASALESGSEDVPF
jgi:hypothetical protein